jgi:hypothetical protein
MHEQLKTRANQNNKWDKWRGEEHARYLGNSIERETTCLVRATPLQAKLGEGNTGRRERLFLRPWGPRFAALAVMTASFRHLSRWSIHALWTAATSREKQLASSGRLRCRQSWVKETRADENACFYTSSARKRRPTMGASFRRPRCNDGLVSPPLALVDSCALDTDQATHSCRPKWRKIRFVRKQTGWE